MKINILHKSDCLLSLTKFDAESINLIVTSPPYANKRNGPKDSKYVEWFLPFTQEFYRVLKNNGSFILNIKESAINGERSTYVLELILEMRKQGWLWVEEYCWHKKNSFPGKWPNRFRDNWERCLHFTKSKKFVMNQKDVMVPIGDWAKTRLKNLSGTDKIRDESKVNSGFGKNISNWVGKEMVYPTNVIHLPTECGNVNHSAAFPVSLPSWFIRLFSNKNDIVLDPFMGSGTTAIACMNLERKYIGFEIDSDFYQDSLRRLQNYDFK